MLRLNLHKPNAPIASSKAAKIVASRRNALADSRTAVRGSSTSNSHGVPLIDCSSPYLSPPPGPFRVKRWITPGFGGACGGGVALTQKSDQTSRVLLLMKTPDPSPISVAIARAAFGDVESFPRSTK